MPVFLFRIFLVVPQYQIILLGDSSSKTACTGTHCQTSSATHRYRSSVSVASLKHSCFQTRSSVHSALGIFLLMRYINLRLLTYLLSHYQSIDLPFATTVVNNVIKRCFSVMKWCKLWNSIWNAKRLGKNF